MTLATLSSVLTPALAQGYAVPGFVCLGWEDARAFTRAAQAEGAPVILQAGPSARAHMPLPVWGAMFRALAADVDIPVVAHLDHATDVEDCCTAIGEGFTSVMFDGSRMSLDHNIAATAEVAALARAAGVSCEGEVGFVGYSRGAPSTGTDPDDAARFAAETGVDALAVSVGNVHLQTEATDGIDRARLAAIEAATTLPLVLHGGSGIPAAQRADLAARSRVCKFNIGTELRQTFGAALRAKLRDCPSSFDRITILKATEAPLTDAARTILRSLGAAGKAT